MSSAISPNSGDGRQQHAARDGDVDAPLEDAVEAAQRHVVEADDRDAVEVLEPRAQRDELQQVGHDVDVDAFAVGGLDEAEHLHVLVERQRDVEVVDVLAADDLVGVGERAEQRQAAVADVIAGRAIVDEADQLEAELAVLEHLVGDHAPEIAGAGDQHALEADAGLPAPLERFADELARRVGEAATLATRNSAQPTCETS